MANLNKVMIIGNVGQEPEMKYTPTGKAVTSFSVAVNSKFKEKETTEWISVVTWGKLAETSNQYLAKGQQVFIEGRLQTRTWDKDGVKHYKTEVVADKVLFLGPRRGISESSDNDPEDLPFD